MRVEDGLLGHPILGVPDDEHGVWPGVSSDDDVLAFAVGCAGDVVALFF